MKNHVAIKAICANKEESGRSGNYVAINAIGENRVDTNQGDSVKSEEVHDMKTMLQLMQQE